MYQKKIFKSIAFLLIQFIWVMSSIAWCADSSTLSPKIVVADIALNELFQESIHSANNSSAVFTIENSSDIQEISQIEMAVDTSNIFFIGKNGEQEIFPDDYEESYVPVYNQLIADIEAFSSEHRASGVEKIHKALLRKNTETLSFWKGMTFRAVVKELLVNAIQSVRESKDGKGKVIVNAKIEKETFIISIIDNGKPLVAEIKSAALQEIFALKASGWMFNGNGWEYSGSKVIEQGESIVKTGEIKLFDAGFTTKLNEWGDNAYGLYYSRLFVEKVLGLDFTEGKKPQLIATDSSYGSKPGTLKTFQVIIPLQINKNPLDAMREYGFINRAI